MIEYAIKAAKESGLFRHIVVSTDDAEIANISKMLGAQVPFFRPHALANDSAETVPVVAHAVSASLALGWSFDKVCCIYPCVPFLTPSDLIAALQCFDDSEAPYCFPVAEFPSPIQRALRRHPEGKLESIHPSNKGTRTQDLEKAYFDTGQFYWGTVEAWCKGLNVHNHAVGYVVPSWRVVDIDTEDDWQRAELLYPFINGTVARNK
jgi:pseudaminic acid cytidylyltransferase